MVLAGMNIAIAKQFAYIATMIQKIKKEFWRQTENSGGFMLVQLFDSTVGDLQGRFVMWHTE